MSLLSSVEQAIKSCKAEQARINESIRLYREILQCLTPPTATDEHHLLDRAEAAVTDINTSPGEKEDIELLERALEKALQVRTSSGKKNPERDKQSRSPYEPDRFVSTSKHIKIPKESQQIRSTSKLTSLEKKSECNATTTTEMRGGRCSTVGTGLSGNRNVGQMKKKSQSSSARFGPQQAARKQQQAGPRSGSLNTISTSHPHKKTTRSSMISWDDSSTAPSNTPEPLSHTDETAALNSQPQGGAYEQITKWKFLRSKENRLWENIIAIQRDTVPGRDHFLHRMRTTFAEDVTCGITDETRAQVNKPSHSRHDVSDRRHRKERHVKSTLQAAAAESEMEAWDRWRPEEGCLCPTGANIGMLSILPLTVTYTTEGELRQLEKQRMQVALLQQEIDLDQALFQVLSPHLSSVCPGSGSPNPSVLRDMYSLLGEGGERFPAVVLDTEPE